MTLNVALDLGAYTWQNQAACRNEDPDLFFGRDGERDSHKARREAVAALVCAGCPVRVACLEHALTKPERDGVWGGLTEDQRETERRRRRRTPAHTRKDTAA